LGYFVVVLDDFSSGKMDNLGSSVGRDSFEMIKGDVRDRKAVGLAMEGIDAVIHLAALIDVRRSVDDPAGTNDVNVNGTLCVLNEASSRCAKRLLFASSAAVYGDGSPSPVKESCLLEPLSPYAASKISAESYCKAFHRSRGLQTVVLRYFNVYGPGQERNPYSGVITRFVSNALAGKPLSVSGDGEQTRDFVNIDDMVDATVLALESERASGNVLNVCTGRPVSINELAQLVKEVTEKELEIVHGEPRAGDVRHSYGDPSKAREVVGFEAKIGLKEGLKRFVDSFHTA
jgi:UDP-glucose 4-epimerase